LSGIGTLAGGVECEIVIGWQPTHALRASNRPSIDKQRHHHYNFYVYISPLTCSCGLSTPAEWPSRLAPSYFAIVPIDAKLLRRYDLKRDRERSIMAIQTKPIPALYTVYILRSAVRHASLYIGSTPNPPRRLSQHNGDVKGGATRTSKGNLRPWEMVGLVAGFPSMVAALKFEYVLYRRPASSSCFPDYRNC